LINIGTNTDEGLNLSTTMFWRGDRMAANKAFVTDRRRVEKRYACEAKIKWSYFNTIKLFEANILNCSPNGIYFETLHEIKTGATVLIRIENFESKNMMPDATHCLRTISLASVKWCKESFNDGDRYFRAGVRHLE